MNTKLNSYIGKKIRIMAQDYRVVFVGDELTTLCELDKNYIHLKYLFNNQFEDLIEEKLVEILKDDERVIDIESLKPSAKERLINLTKIMNELLEHYGEGLTLFKNKNSDGFIKELSAKYNLSQKIIRRSFTKFIQSGKSISSLSDHRMGNTKTGEFIKYSKKTGRPNKDGIKEGIILTPKVYKEFDKVIKTFKSGRQSTIIGAYTELINDYYSNYNPNTNKREWYPASQRPTYRQFYNYIKRVMTKADFEIQKTSVREYENNKRLLLSSSSRLNVFKPGQVIEIDALEVDISIVSSIDKTQCIGRPICYFMIDVLTSAIVSFSVSLENNSIIGLTNVMTNMADDKVELCLKYGIDIEDRDFPSKFIPNEIRIDRGADFKSDKFVEMCEQLGITINLLPPGMGSFKPHVEQSFHQFQSTFRGKFENFGLITKRHDSNHHREALLTIEGVREMVINYIVYHNKRVNTGYKLSKELLEIKDFKPTPANLWEYYVSKMGQPKPITNNNKNQYIYNFLLKDNAKLTRMGIKYKNLFYLVDNDDLKLEMYKLGNKKEDFKIKYDPRSTNNLYCMIEGILYVAYLNPDIPNNLNFINMTWKTYKEYYSKANKIKREGIKENVENKAALQDKYTNIISDNYIETLANTNNIKESRTKEKELINTSESLINKVEPNQNNSVNEIDNRSKQDEDDADISKSFDSIEEAEEALKDAIRNFY